MTYSKQNACQVLKISNTNYNNNTSNKDVFKVISGYVQIGIKGANGSIWSGVILSVYGKVLASSFHINIDPSKWADYVFNESYNLAKLVEVEAYYKTLQHFFRNTKRIRNRRKRKRLS